MTDDCTHRIDEAIHDCLERCYRSNTPLSCLAEYVFGLRADPSWNESKIREVETTVRRMVRMLDSAPDFAA